MADAILLLAIALLPAGILAAVKKGFNEVITGLEALYKAAGSSRRG